MRGQADRARDTINACIANAAEPRQARDPRLLTLQTATPGTSLVPGRPLTIPAPSVRASQDATVLRSARRGDGFTIRSPSRRQSGAEVTLQVQHFRREKLVDHPLDPPEAVFLQVFFRWLVIDPG